MTELPAEPYRRSATAPSSDSEISRRLRRNSTYHHTVITAYSLSSSWSSRSSLSMYSESTTRSLLRQDWRYEFRKRIANVIKIEQH